MNRPARFTVADLRRALRAAKQEGEDWAVEVDADGTIRIVRKSEARSRGRGAVEEHEEIVLW